METFIYHSKPTWLYNPRVTVAGKIEDNKLKLAVARCSEKDQFIKKVGRELSIERLNNNQLISEVDVTGIEKINGLFVDLAREIAYVCDELGTHIKINFTPTVSLNMEVVKE